MDKTTLGYPHCRHCCKVGNVKPEAHTFPCSHAGCQASVPVANGYVVVPQHLLDDLIAASGDFSTGRKQALRLLAARAAVVEAVGPTTPKTCSTCNQPLGTPGCSLHHDTGRSGHTVSDGVFWFEAVGPTT